MTKATDKTAGASQFDGLLADLAGVTDMAKSLPAADAAADDADKEKPEGEGADADDDQIAAAAAEGEDKPEMAKSFKVTMDDGTEQDAIDGTELIKALMTRVETGEVSTKQVLTETVGAVVGLGAMVKSLQDQVAALAGSGLRRKAVISVVEKPATAAETLAKSLAAEEGEGLSGDDFMAKALSAQASGKITGHMVAIAEGYINNGQQPPAEIVRAVLA